MSEETAGTQATVDLTSLGPLYHDYTPLGGYNVQLPGHYIANQKCKAPIIEQHMNYALHNAKRDAPQGATFAELFCADGYYAMLATKLGATQSFAIDNNRDGHTEMGSTIASMLNFRNVRFLTMDVHDIDALMHVDVVANVGGLYHVADPEAVLEKSYEFCRRYLIVQTVVSMATQDSTYFETPAPGWTWGSRYSRESFDALIARTGWRVKDKQFNILRGNHRPEDRGSCYYLIEKTWT